MEAPAEAAEQRDWLALPAGVLQLIFCLASRQTPGSCLAALVCHVWRAAAGGCSNIRLLYHVGRVPTDLCFATWLECSSRQLEALIISCDGSNCGLIMAALAQAAAAAQAAGRPLRLHTLRVLGECVPLPTAGQLLARLPHLRCLQLAMRWAGYDSLASVKRTQEILQHLAPLQQATHLEELYLTGPGHLIQDMGRLLPPSLKRLSWDPVQYTMRYGLSHLTRLTFLQLCDWPWELLSSSDLPSGLQQLEVVDKDNDYLTVLEEQREVVTAWDIEDLEEEDVQRLLPRLPNLRAVTVDLADVAATAALKHLTQLSSLALYNINVLSKGKRRAMQALVATAAGLRSLRRLDLDFHALSAPLAWDGLTQLTHLGLSVGEPAETSQQEQQAWAEMLGRMAGLRWLSVPGVLLAADQAWLSCLQQQLRGCWWWMWMKV
jgi:hypothetical protein